MKRSSGNNDSPPSKLPKGGGEGLNVILRFLIPARAAGIMIGKGGENIKKIRTQDIMNAKLSDPRRIMGGGPYRSRKMTDGDDPEKEEDGEDYMLDYRILVHESQAGSVIGRGGERIKDLRKSAPPRGPREDYDAANFSESDALSYGGWLTREAVEAMSQSGYQRGPAGMPPAYMGGGHYGMGAPDMMPQMGGGPGPRGPRPHMGGSGYRGAGGYTPPRGAPAPVPPPGPRPMGGGYGGGSAGMYDSSSIPPTYDDSSYNGSGMYGSRGVVDHTAYPGQSYGGSSAAGVTSGGYGASGYPGARPVVDNAPPAGMPRGGYGGYGGGAAQAPHDQKASQWYGGWA